MRSDHNNKIHEQHIVDSQGTLTQHWDKLPLDIQVSVTNFLTTREISLFSRVNHKEYDANRNIYICSQLNLHADQIITTDDLSNVIAQLLKVKPDDIKNSERFESTIIHFIRKLDFQQVPFLNINTDVTDKAGYILSDQRIGFQYRQFAKEQVIILAKILEQFFNGIKSNVSQVVENEAYWITCDKNVFLQQVLPCVFEVNKIPQKQIQFQQPVVRDWAPTKKYFIMRKDNAPFTEDDKKLIGQQQSRGF